MAAWPFGPCLTPSFFSDGCPPPHRCSKLGIACIEQVRSQGRPRKLLTETLAPETKGKGRKKQRRSSLAEECAGPATDEAEATAHDDSSSSSGSSSEAQDLGIGAHVTDYPVGSLATIISQAFTPLYRRGLFPDDQITAVL